MNITILAVGSRGDVQPYVALGKGLQAAGHTVRVGTHAIFEEFVRGNGLDFALISLNPQEMLKKEAGQVWMASGSNPFRFLSQFTRIFQPLTYQLLTDCWHACQGADALILSPLSVGAYSVAEKLGVPCFAAALWAGLPTRAFPSIYAPQLPLGGTYNILTYRVMALPKGFLGRPLWQAINQWRQEFLGLPPRPISEVRNELGQGKLPMLCGFSPSVVSRPTDWPTWAHITGYWFLDRAPDWEPPSALVDFLDAGPPPVYVGFGSMSGRDPAATTDMVVRALRAAGQRGILLGGWGELGGSDLPDDVFGIDSVPHDWLFPRVAAVVHHGGAGTTAAGLRAGIPSILTPFFGDQPFWARRVAALGVGPQAIPHKKLSVERLAAAIRLATSDEGMKARAAALGQRIRAEDGVAEAIKVIHRHLDGHGAHQMVPGAVPLPA